MFHSRENNSGMVEGSIVLLRRNICLREDEFVRVCDCNPVVVLCYLLTTSNVATHTTPTRRLHIMVVHKPGTHVDDGGNDPRLRWHSTATRKLHEIDAGPRFNKVGSAINGQQWVCMA